MSLLEKRQLSGHPKDIWAPAKEDGKGGGGGGGQRAEINTRHRLDQSQGDLEPIGHILSGLLKFCYVICFSEEQRREAVCVCVCSPTKSRPGSPSPCRAVTPGISGMRARLSLV